MKMTVLTSMADSLYEAVDKGDTDAVMDLLKRGANVNILPSCGRTNLGRAAQLGHLAIVCLLLDAEKFSTTPEEEDIENDLFNMPSSEPVPPMPTISVDHPPQHKCCSPSIDSETCTCSDEVWGLDASDSNTGQQSDIETAVATASKGTMTEIPKIQNKEECNSVEVDGTTFNPNTNSAISSSFITTTYNNCTFNSGNIGYFVYEYREEEEDTGDSSGPVLSSTEDSDSALERRQLPPPIRPSSSILLHRTLGRGRANIVSSDSEFETDNCRRRRHAKHYHRSHRHEREHVRHKSLVHPHHSSPWLDTLHSEYISLGLASPWSLRRSCEVNQLDAYGRSALHYATEQGHTYIVHMLIKAGMRVDTLDAEHMTALHLASQRGLTEVVTLLLDNGAKVNNKMNDKSSPLHIAASRGYTDIVETLLNRGAKIDSLDSSDRTPLILAVSRAHHRIVQVLLKRGAKVNIEEIHGYTPLCEAVWQKDIKLIQLLLTARAKVTQSHFLLHYAVLHRLEKIAELLLGARCMVNLRDDNGDTPLIIAARTCQPTVIKLLLKNGANPNYPNGLTGTKPLHEAVEGTRDAQFDDFLFVFQLLRSYGAKLDVETVTSGDTPLCRALLLEKNKAAALLIREGCDINSNSLVSNMDYLRMATLQGNTHLVNLMILAGIKVQKASWLTGNHTPGTLMAKLSVIKSTPLNLTNLTRIAIRQRLGDTVQQTVHKLPLPQQLIKFLTLTEVSELEI